MLNFVYDNKTTLIFGKGTHHETGTLLKPLGKKILLHYGSGSIRRSGLYDAVTASLKAAGVEYEELGGVQATLRCPWCMKASASAGNTAWASCWPWEEAA